jgi:hypothetical protein
MTLALTQYRIRYWEAGREYTMVVGASNPESVREWLKKKYNKFKMEEINENKS